MGVESRAAGLASRRVTDDRRVGRWLPFDVSSAIVAGRDEVRGSRSIDASAHRSGQPRPPSHPFLIRSVTLRGLFARSSSTPSFSPSRGGVGSRPSSSDKDEGVGSCECYSFCL